LPISSFNHRLFVETQYKIIGGDGREYGPATLEELRGWVRDGRIAGATPIWRSDTALWSPASQFGEIRGDLAHVIAQAGLAAANAARPAGFFARLAAFILDMLVLWFLVFLLWPGIAAFAHITIPPPPEQFTSTDQLMDYMKLLQPVLLVFEVLRLLYEIVFNGTFGATLGKMAIGARIVRMDGSRIGYGIAAARWLGERLSDFLFFAGYLFIAFRPDKRALHDLLVGTRVIQKR
jgi:uncharacterized RDD family membrane protein YckC